MIEEEIDYLKKEIQYLTIKLKKLEEKIEIFDEMSSNCIKMTMEQNSSQLIDIHKKFESIQNVLDLHEKKLTKK